MLDLDNDFYKNPGKFIYECQDVVFENFDSSKKEFIKSNLRHDSYTDLKYFRKFSDMTQFYKLSEWDYLYEGLVRSADITTVVKRLRQYEELYLIDSVRSEGFTLGNKTQYVSFFMPIEFYNNDDKNQLYYYEVENAKRNLFRDISNLGYFIAVTKQVKGNDGNEYMYIAIHPKFIIEVTDKIYSNKINGVLYHITPTKNLAKMNKNGLIPRNSNTYETYPDRIYFYLHINDKYAEKYISEHFKKFKEDKLKKLNKAVRDFKNGVITEKKFRYIVEHRYDYRSFTILKIDLKEKRFFEKDDITTHYKFFDDPKSEGVFTYENIDPMCISVYKTIEMDDTDDFEFVLEFLNDK